MVQNEDLLREAYKQVKQLSEYGRVATPESFEKWVEGLEEEVNSER